MYRRYQAHEPAPQHRPTPPAPPKPQAKNMTKPHVPSGGALRIPFLEKLFPHMDGGDLLVLLILLFLLAEGNEESSSVILTLVIFLFL